jgi:hypothetical protein
VLCCTYAAAGKGAPPAPLAAKRTTTKEEIQRGGLCKRPRAAFRALYPRRRPKEAATPSHARSRSSLELLRHVDAWRAVMLQRGVVRSRAGHGVGRMPLAKDEPRQEALAYPTT